MSLEILQAIRKNGLSSSYSFVHIQVSLTSLVLKYKIQKNTLSKAWPSQANFNYNKRILTQQPLLHWAHVVCIVLD